MSVLEQETTFPWPTRLDTANSSPNWARAYRRRLIVVDGVAVLLATALSYIFVSIAPRVAVSGFFGVTYEILALVLVIAWLVSLSATDSRNERLLGSGTEEYQRVMKATLYLFGAVAILAFMLQVQVSRGLFVVMLPVGTLLLLFGRWVLRRQLNRARNAGKALEPTLIVGAPGYVSDLVADLRKHAELGYQPAGVCLVGADPEQTNAQVLDVACEHDLSTLFDTVGSGQYGAVVLTEGLTRAQVKRVAWHMERQPTQLLMVPRLADVSGPRMSVRETDSISLMHVELPEFTGWKTVVKRTFDALFAGAVLVLLAPLFAVIALAIKFDDRGPVFFRQQRVGRNGEPFTIHKFRSMCLDAEDKIADLIAQNGGSALLFKMEDDPRITRVGKFLRKYSLDELPQFWTVLRGRMSIVGPRPQVDREVAEYTDVHYRRLLIKPGITGLWQVNGRSALTPEESVRLDLRYVENWSVVGDIVIILKTVGVVVRGSGAY